MECVRTGGEEMWKEQVELQKFVVAMIERGFRGQGCGEKGVGFRRGL